MSKSPIIPRSDGDFLRWSKHFNGHLAEVKAALGLTDEDLATGAAYNQSLDAAFTDSDHAGAVAKQATGRKVAIREAAEDYLHGVIRRIKAAPGYTQAIGILLGIEAAENKIDPATMKPTLTVLEAGDGKPHLAFHKGHSHGVKVFCKREGEIEFTYLDRCTVSPYIDNRPLLVPGKAEVRKYKAIFVHGDTEFGQFSDQVNVTCSP
jgi:hypothetical protein